MSISIYEKGCDSVVRTIYLTGNDQGGRGKKGKCTSLALSLILIFGSLIGMLGTVTAPAPPPYNVWGTANEGIAPPGTGVVDGSELTAWIDGVYYGTTTTTGSMFDLYINSDYWGVPSDNFVKDGGFNGDTLMFFLNYNPMDYYLNVSHATSSHKEGGLEDFGIMFFNRTDQASSLTTLRLLKINEIVLDPGDGLPQYVIIYDPGQNLGMNNITDYYLQKDNNVSHTTDGEKFDFLAHVSDVTDMSGGYYTINLTSDLALNDSDELKLVWKSPYTPNPDPALTGPGNGTDIVVDRVEWGNYTNYISPVTPPDDRDYDNTTLLDFVDVSSLYGSGASMIRTDDKFSSGYSGNGTDTDNCYADFKVLGTCTPRPQQVSYPVHNVDTDEYFHEIQAAIDDPDTQDGHTITVMAGIYTENVVVNKTINLTGEDRDTTIIDGEASSDVINVSANWVNITGFTITNGSSNWDDAGIEFYNAENCSVISNNIVSNLRDGIILFTSSNISIFDNNVSNNGWHGIIGYFSSYNTMENNNITLNNWEGILLREDSSFNKIIECNVSNNTAGINIVYSSGNNVIENTTVSANEQHAIYVHHSSNNNTIMGCNISNNGGYGVYIYNSTFNNITSCVIIKNDQGISLYESSNNIIINNVIKNNSWGIYYWYSTKNNIISNCDLHNNMQGIRVGHSTTTDNHIRNCNITSNKEYGLYFRSFTQNNFIYHNNIINNAIHAYDDSNNGNQWDNGYPSGGNYWSGYTGVDLNSTPTQDVPPPDGIGDTPFIIDSNSRDNYPLMFPIGNFTFLYPGWNLISIPFTQSNSSLGNVLSTIEGYYDAVQWYNSSETSDPWKHYHISKPPQLNDLAEINHFIGFWIHIRDPSGVLFDFPGTQPTVNQSITLHQGWNMVGYPSLYNRNRTAALNNINYGSDVDAIWTFNAATQTWQEIGPSDYFELGRGYWIHSKVTKVWDVPL